MTLDGGQWAAWIQAIGSIIAIVASAVLVWWQHHLEAGRESKKEAQKRYDFISAVTAVVHDIAGLIESAAQAANNPEERENYFSDDSDRRKLSDCLHALNAIPAHELPGYELASRLIALRHITQDALSSWASFVEIMNGAEHPENEYGWPIYDLSSAMQEVPYAVKEFTAAMAKAAQEAAI
jgi:hypothetical protein